VVVADDRANEHGRPAETSRSQSFQYSAEELRLPWQCTESRLAWHITWRRNSAPLSSVVYSRQWFAAGNSQPAICMLGTLDDSTPTKRWLIIMLFIFIVQPTTQERNCFFVIVGLSVSRGTVHFNIGPTEWSKNNPLFVTTDWDFIKILADFKKKIFWINTNNHKRNTAKRLRCDGNGIYS